MGITVSAAFDGGNIRHVATEGDRVDLEIVADRDSPFYQWFFFRLAGARGRALRLRIVNAGAAAFPGGWPGYAARASTNLVDWRSLPTRYADGVLEFDWAGNLAWFAYSAPYTSERHAALLARMAGLPGVTHRELGLSLEGRPIDCLSLGEGTTPVWLFARQHPGEPMAAWWMEGALDRLARDPPAGLLRTATLHLVPNMNPDGTARGHLRTNAAGVNLNREWHDPSAGRSPEVLCVRDAMDATGVALAIDVHGDEAIPAPFLVGFDGVPSWTAERGARFDAFRQRLAAHTPDFQTALGYGRTPAGKANMTIATNQLAERHGALAMTLELPFKDFDARPDPVHGWSPARSMALGAACVEVIAATLCEP